jgi:phage gp46-like protein
MFEVVDIRLVQDSRPPYYQINADFLLLPNGTLDDTQALATAVVVALGTNGLADADDILPDPDSSNRMGWWGDLDADVIWNGWPIGSKLWLERRAAIESSQSGRGSTLAWIKDYIYFALQPFVDRRIISSFDAYVERVNVQRIDSLITLYRGPTPVIDMRFAILWDEQQRAAASSLAPPPYQG